MMYSLVSLPRNTLKKIEQLICERLENNVLGLKSASVELPRKEGVSPVPLCLSSWLGG